MNDPTTSTPINGSIVSVPTRCPLWGRADYRGNCDGTLIKDLLLRYRPRSVADPMEGSGTTRDVVAWMNHNHRTDITYWGGDLRSGFNLVQQDIPGMFDFMWIHPPYWNIIPYTDHKDDLSRMPSYPVYHDALHLCLLRCCLALNPGGRLAVLVGDVRRGGTYTPIVRDVLNLAGKIGELRSVIIKAQHNCRSDAVAYARMEDPPIRHEYCVVFKRPVATRSDRNDINSL